MGGFPNGILILEDQTFGFEMCARRLLKVMARCTQNFTRPCLSSPSRDSPRWHALSLAHLAHGFLFASANPEADQEVDLPD